MFNLKKYYYIIIPAAFLLLFSLLRRFYPEIVLGFSFPSAWLTSLYFDTGVIRGEGLSYIIPQAAVPLEVVPACSGYDFWLISSAFILFQWFKERSIALYGIFSGFLFLPAAYGITVLLNAMRFIGTVALKTAYTYLLPASYWHVVHLFFGVTIFLPALIIMNILLSRRFFHERKNNS